MRVNVSFKKLLNYHGSSSVRIIIYSTQYYKVIKDKNNNFINRPMNRTRPYLNKFIKQKEQEITDTYHNLNMKQMKPITSKLMEHSDTIIINNSKREKIKEVREIEIERENRVLLDKISSVMSKKGAYSVSKSKNIRTRANKSLNQIFRKQQDESITEQNKRFLSRLQNKKPTLNLQKLNKDWKDNKSVMKRMSNIEFYLATFKSKDVHKSGMTSQRSIQHKIQLINMQKTKVIDGCKFLIRIEFTQGFLKITGDSNNKSLKIIEVPKEEAIVFLEQDCSGDPEKLIKKLKYDHANDTLYLISSTLQFQDQRNNPEALTQRKPKQLSEIKQKRKKSDLDQKKQIEVSNKSQALNNSKNKNTIKSSKSNENMNKLIQQHKQERVDRVGSKIEPQEQKFQEQDEAFEEYKQQQPKEEVSPAKKETPKEEAKKKPSGQGQAKPQAQEENEIYEQEFEESKQVKVEVGPQGKV